MITGFTVHSGPTNVSGTGGAMRISFAAGRYTMTSTGKNPIKLTYDKLHLSLVVNGTVAGRYGGTGQTAVFLPGTSTGTATVTGSAGKRSISMKDVAGLVTPQGTVNVTCAKDTASFTSANTKIELRKV